MKQDTRTRRIRYFGASEIRGTAPPHHEVSLTKCCEWRGVFTRTRDGNNLAVGEWSRAPRSDAGRQLLNKSVASLADSENWRDGAHGTRSDVTVVCDC